MAAGAKLNRFKSVVFGGTTFVTVLDVQDNYPANFNMTKGGGSLTTLHALRDFAGEVTVTYQGWVATRLPSGGTPDDLVVIIFDQDGAEVTTTYPSLVPSGPAFQMPNSDFGTYVQKFILAAPLDNTAGAQTTYLPTTS